MSLDFALLLMLFKAFDDRTPKVEVAKTNAIYTQYEL